MLHSMNKDTFMLLFKLKMCTLKRYITNVKSYLVNKCISHHLTWLKEVLISLVINWKQKLLLINWLKLTGKLTLNLKISFKIKSISYSILQVTISLTSKMICYKMLKCPLFHLEPNRTWICSLETTVKKSLMLMFKAQILKPVCLIYSKQKLIMIPHMVIKMVN